MTNLNLNHVKKSGEIQLIIGPMFSGKTTEMLRRVRRYALANYSCCLIKYYKDKRYTEENCISTHDEQFATAYPSSTLSEIEEKVSQHHVIGIDEGQFFPDIVEFCETQANNGKVIIVSALDGTYLRQPFGSVLNLVPLSETVIKLKAVCVSCYGDAAFTKRIVDSEELELIGGIDKYMAVCRMCFSKKINET